MPEHLFIQNWFYCAIMLILLFLACFIGWLLIFSLTEKSSCDRIKFVTTTLNLSNLSKRLIFNPKSIFCYILFLSSNKINIQAE